MFRLAMTFMDRRKYNINRYVMIKSTILRNYTQKDNVTYDIEPCYYFPIDDGYVNVLHHGSGIVVQTTQWKL